jgi:tetratricopeptide (TPR) repeat protein
MGLGGTYQQLMDFNTALHYEEKCLLIAEKLNFKDGMSRANGSIVGNYKLHNKYGEALKDFFKGIAINRSYITILQNLSLIRYNLKRFSFILINFIESEPDCR